MEHALKFALSVEATEKYVPTFSHDTLLLQTTWTLGVVEVFSVFSLYNVVMVLGSEAYLIPLVAIPKTCRSV